jgi:nucleoside 2-deoxyribosyltransferase
MRIYIGCGLTHVPREVFAEYTGFVRELASTLEVAHEVRYALRDSDPQLAQREPMERARLCYSWDRRMVESADAVVAEVSFASTGLGVELQIAEAKDTPVILCYRDWGTNRASPATYQTPDRQRHLLQIGDGFVSLMALGMPNIVQVVEYQPGASGVEQVVGAVEGIACGSPNRR